MIRLDVGRPHAPRMRYGYWMPVFGGWLRNVADEGMEASWAYPSVWLAGAKRSGLTLR